MSLAAAYAMKKKNMCHGGAMADGGEIVKADKKTADSFRKAFGMAEGGEVKPCEKCGHVAEHMEEKMEGEGDMMDDDLVERIMKAKKFSKGGRVANDSDPMADGEEAEFDDLVKDDDMDFKYTGKNSGDEDGNEELDDENDDIVARAMKSRKKKDKMPRPA